MSREAMKLALEALELCNGAETAEGVVVYTDKEITALREALAEQPARPYRQLQDNGSKYFGDSWDKAEQPAQQEPVNEGWKLVPVEPTEDMWKAVNKLDDEMAAGSYDGKGCSIEQAWNCLLDAAPTPPAQRTWVDLTDDEIKKEFHPLHATGLQFARAVLAKSKEKNA